MSEVILLVLSLVVLPVLINKSTEGEQFNWLKPRLREAWTGVFLYFCGYCLHKEEMVVRVAKLHTILPGLRGYGVAALVGATLLCVYWWFAGRVLHPSGHIAEDPRASSPPKQTSSWDAKPRVVAPKPQHRGPSIINSIPPSSAPATGSSPDPAYKLLADAETLDRNLLAFQEATVTGWQILDRDMEFERQKMYSTPDRQGLFAEDKARRQTEQNRSDMNLYREEYAQEAVRVRKALMEQLPAHGYEAGLDYGNPGNGGGVSRIRFDLEDLIAEYRAKLAKVSPKPQ